MNQSEFEKFRQRFVEEVSDIERGLDDVNEVIDELQANTIDNAQSLRLSIDRLERQIAILTRRLIVLEDKYGD